MIDEKIYINGGNKLSGEISIDGSKNSALACIAAASLTEDEIRLKNVPDISDIDVLVSILRNAGKEIEWHENALCIKGPLQKTSISQELATKIRASIYCLGLFLATKGKAEIPLPGGDKIGDRPIDIHLEGLKDIGVQIECSRGMVSAELMSKISENIVFLRYPSVGATCNLLLVASRINERIIIKNAAKEPEIVDVANLLSKMGVKILGAGSDTITIVGCKNLTGNFCHEIIPDRIETGIILTTIAASGGRGIIKNAIPEHNLALICTLKKSGVKITVGNDNYLFVEGLANYNPINVTAMPYPGVPTDLQPLLSVFSQQCKGESIITDMVFPERFSYINELIKLGAKIIHFGNTIRITGVDELYGAHVEGNEIRGVTALVCAGLIAKNKTVVTGLYHLKRGYKDLCGKLNLLGADITVK